MDRRRLLGVDYICDWTREREQHWEKHQTMEQAEQDGQNKDLVLTRFTSDILTGFCLVYLEK